MKRSSRTLGLALAACFASASALPAAPARAQSDDALLPATQWIHPEGFYSLDIGGFKNRGRRDYIVLALLMPADSPSETPRVWCTVVQRPLLTDGTLASSLADDLLRRRIGRPVVESAIGGVTVFSWEVEHRSFAFHHRAFQLPSARGSDYHELWCGGAEPISPAQWRSMDTLLNSLDFSRN